MKRETYKFIYTAFAGNKNSFRKILFLIVISTLGAFVEIGFLSNKQEEKKLINSKYLRELSKNLAIAIENYFENN